MTFERVHKAVVYGLVVVGLLPLVLSGEVPVPIIAVVYLATAVSWFYEVPRQRVEAHTRAWTGVTIAGLAGCIALGAATGNVLFYAIVFALIMVVTRLFQSRGSRDVFQLYGLTFIAMIAGAVVNPSMAFLLSFVGYIVLLTWGLVLLHLQRDLESLAAESDILGEQPADVGWQARSLVTPGFLAGTSLLALLVFVSSLAVFFFFPRLGMGFFFGQGREPHRVSGFSDTIELGHFGTIKDDMRVIMRVELPEEPEAGQGRRLRMRGISFDRYDGRSWSKSAKTKTSWEMEREAEGTWRLHHALSQAVDDRGADDSRRVVQLIYLEPLEVDRRVVFGLPRVQTVSIDNPRLDALKRDRTVFYQDLADDMTTRGRTDTALRYTAVSTVARIDAATARERSDDVHEAAPYIADQYLQLPNRLNPAIASLAVEIVGERTHPYDKAAAIQEYLRTQFQYSTQGGHDPAAPMDDFLFRKRVGHCEYFASAMAIMLRTVDVPARPVNGFYGGAYNTFGGYFAMRQADAHSWVEAWLPGQGWSTFDPTPSQSVLVPKEGGFWGTIDEFIDSVRLRWYKWVVEFDLDKQLEMLREIGRVLKDLMPGSEDGNEQSVGDTVLSWLKRPTTWLFFGLPLFLVLAWRFQLWRKLRSWLATLFARSPTPADVAGQLYARMLRRLARQGFQRSRSETPRELAARVSRAGHPAAAEVVTLTDAFERARYADLELPGDALTQLRAALAAVRRSKVA